MESKVNDTIDFFRDANDFLTAQLPEDFEDRLRKHVKERNYTQNEYRLFKHMLQESLDFKGVMILLKDFT